jgi:hypothetical protein
LGGSAELVLDNQPRIDKKDNSIVESRPAHPEILLVHHPRIEHIYIEMAVNRIDSIEYGVAFRSLTMPVRREIFRKYLPYCIFHILSFHYQPKLARTKLSLFCGKQKKFL